MGPWRIQSKKRPSKKSDFQLANLLIKSARDVTSKTMSSFMRNSKVYWRTLEKQPTTKIYMLRQRRTSVHSQHAARERCWFRYCRTVCLLAYLIDSEKTVGTFHILKRNVHALLSRGLVILKVLKPLQYREIFRPDSQLKEWSDLRSMLLSLRFQPTSSCI